MSKIFTITKGEFFRYFTSPLAYVYLVCFLLLNSSFALYFGGIFTQGNASLKAMFELLPWFYLLFVTGISMRLWAEEFKSGTILQIMSLPLPIGAFVWGKFLAAWCFCTLALGLTFPFVITLNILGTPDNWVIFSGYLGAFLLAGAMLAISQTASALTKNQVISLVISVFFNLLFFLSGLEYVLGFFRTFAPDYIVQMIANFSFLTHLSTLSLGLLDLNSIIFFASLILLFNFFTTTIINLRTVGTAFWLKKPSLSGYLIAVILLITSFISINLFSNNFLRQYKADFTEERLFSLSPSTVNILTNLPAKVTAKVYYSPLLGQRDKNMRLAFDKLKLLLAEYHKISPQNFEYIIYNPEPLSDIEDRALTSGVQPLPVSDLNTAAYFGIVLVNENGKSSTIPFMPLARQNLMEHDITSHIFMLEHSQKKLGVFSSLPLLGSTDTNINRQPWQIISEISNFYNIRQVLAPLDLEDLDVLLIAHPQNLSSEMQDAIYNFSISGGKILAFFDVVTESSYLTGPQTKLLQSSDYGDLPQKWGFKFHDNMVIADLENSSQVELQSSDYTGVSQDLIQFYLTDKNFFADLPETKNLKRILLTSASFFVPISDAPVYFVPLIKSSPQSQALPSAVVSKNIHPAEILRQFKADKLNKYIAAHIVSQQPNKPFEIIVVGDTDMLYDTFWTTSATIGEQNYNIPLLDNSNFVLNALDTLTGNDSLIALRGKSPKKRPFFLLDQAQKENLRQFKIKEKDTFDQIRLIKEGLQEIRNKKDFEQRQNFTPEELSIINKIKLQLDSKRQELYQIRQNLNHNMQTIELWIKIFNIYTIPLLLIIIVLATKSRLFAWRKPCFPRFNYKFSFILILTGLSIFLGTLGVILHPNTSLSSYEGKPLFTGLIQRANSINSISLQNHDNHLVFVKKDSLWTLQNNPDFLVDQKRIKNFLMTLMQATIYERKSDKLENLSRFGLLPIEHPDSTTTSITLKDSKDNIIEQFDVGNYNIDLGRGALGAFIRRPSQFEIWLSHIEITDLGLDYHNWGFGKLWSLQFGRFNLNDTIRDEKQLINIARLLLNTETDIIDNQNLTTPDFKLHLKGEFFDDMTINFHQADNNYIVEYIFNSQPSDPLLSLFAQKTANRQFTISTHNAKKIKNVLNTD